MTEQENQTEELPGGFKIRNAAQTHFVTMIYNALDKLEQRYTIKLVSGSPVD